jgi:hypothetical protein
MFAKKYPEMEKSVYCAKKLSLFEYWRDIRFHKNLWKVDERMRELYLQTEFKEECIAEGEQNIINLLKSGKTPEEIIRDYDN